MSAITEKTSVGKNMRGLWEAQTITTVNGQTFKITTMKRHSGKVVSNVMPVSASKSEGMVITSFSSTDLFQNLTELISRDVRATEKAIRQQHAEAVILFDQMAENGGIKGLKEDAPARPEIGTIIYLEGYGKHKGSEGNKNIVYDIEKTDFGTYYKTVEIDTLRLQSIDYPTHEKDIFGIGNYYGSEKFQGTADELNNLVIEAKVKERKWQDQELIKQDLAKKERLRKIEEGKKLITVPSWAKSVIVADLYQDDSDSMTDYFSTSVSKRVYLAWSRSDRNNIKELHKAKVNFEETAELEGESTRDHSYLPNYFVGDDRWYGWKVNKDKLFFKYDEQSKLNDLYIAASEGRVFFPTEEEKTKPESVNVEGVQFIDYSEKAFAIIGDTREIRDQLKELGGRWNNRLSCGAGWIFSKTKSEKQVKEFLNL